MASDAGPKLAIVEDDATLVAILSDQLVDAGFEVVAYRSGEEALRELWFGGADLLLTDLLLPRMGGLDLVRELRTRPWARALPVIGVTALQMLDTQREGVEQAIAPGKLLSKPVDPAALLNAVTSLLASAENRPPLPPEPVRNARPTTASMVVPREAQAVQLEVAVNAATELVNEYTQNLAHGGIFLSSYHPLPVETDVDVLLTLPFRKPLRLHGKVVRAVATESPEALTHGPGMAVAFEAMPKDLKRELAAFVAGLRAGTAAAVAARDRALLLVGLRGALLSDVAGLLRRSAIRTLHADTLAGALEQIALHAPALVAVGGPVLEQDPARVIREITALGAHDVLAVASREVAAQLPRDTPSVDATLEPRALLQALSHALELSLRATARASLEAEVMARRSDGSLKGRIENVSLGGVLLATDASCAVGEQLHLEFPLPGGDTVRCVVRTVRVVRRDPSGELLVAGSIERLDPDSTEALRRYVEERVGAEAYSRFVSSSLRLHEREPRARA
ncbi:MAG: PilZ domain-containing protein [Deltaproteobacteria bacterium]|nr:PilZ domain-containing protein [Deltaproteobacteria bacterium]